MTTTTVPIEIVCPPWCEEEPAAHVAELWNNEGMCIHAGGVVAGLVEDTTGMLDHALAEPRMLEPVSSLLYATTWPDGRECASPSIYLNDTEMTLEQAEQLAEILQQQVAAHRSWKAAQS